jgi:hypothetical protein
MEHNIFFKKIFSKTKLFYMKQMDMSIYIRAQSILFDIL